MAYLLDTNACIQILNSKNSIVELQQLNQIIQRHLMI